MISAPGAPMLDSKLFVSRLDGAFRDLYERWWDGDEWIWVNHGRPEGVDVTGDPGAEMMGEKLFVTVRDGRLWERHWRPDLGRWAWEDHGRPDNRPIVAGPGAAMMDEKLFVVVDDGRLWERHWRPDLGRWAWEDHGRPQNRRIVAAPGAAMMNQKLFVSVDDGRVFERHWRADLGSWVWHDHGRPPGTDARTAPGAAMLNSKFFVGAGDGRLFERYWNGSAWVWVDHGRPGGSGVAAAPGAAMMGAKLFVTTDDGRLFERYWNGSAWVWVDHGRPPGTRARGAPGAAMMSSKLFVAADDGRLFERYWNGSEWVWVNHGTALHDDAQHVIGAPGTDPKLTIAIMGDGFSEGTIGEYRQLVSDRVVAALRRDQLADHQAALRVVRIDVVSVEDGVIERRYDDAGTTDPADDTVSSETYRFSRLGYVSTGNWSHCWIETSAHTNPRIDKLRRRFAPDATRVIVLVRSDQPGGCNRGSTATFTTREGADTIAHELGHNLFALGDEYNNDTRAFSGTTPYANLTERPADWASFKWRDLVQAGAPLPTDAAALPPGWNNETSVGAFEGGGAWYATGIFRPVLRCRMNQNSPPWCPVCARKLGRDLEPFE